MNFFFFLVLLSDSEKTDDSSSFLTGRNQNIKKSAYEKRHIPSASSALVIGGVLGLLQAIILIFAARPMLNFMGVHSASVLT